MADKEMTMTTTTTPYTRAESDRRAAASICCRAIYLDAARTRAGFPCDRATATPGGGFCPACDAADQAEEGRCDGLAAARGDHQADE